MQLKTERLSIRRVEKADWKSIKGIWEDFNLSEYSVYDKARNTDDADVCERISKWAGMAHSMDHMFFAVCLEDVLIGYIAFNIREDSYELGYCFHSRYFGNGYAKESLKALFNYMKSIGTKKITAGTALNNTPSVALLHSLGFKKTGEERVSFYKDNEEKDIFFDGGIFELLL